MNWFQIVAGNIKSPPIEADFNGVNWFQIVAWNTQESIADILGVTHPTIMNICDNVKKGQLSNFYNTFKPLLYNIWNLGKQDNERKHYLFFIRRRIARKPS